MNEKKIAKAFELFAKVQAVAIRVEGMKALNHERVEQDLALAYSDDAFEEMAAEIDICVAELAALQT